MDSNKEKTNKVEIKLSLDKDTVEFLEAEAETRKATLEDLLHSMIERECEHLDEQPHYLTGMKINPRYFHRQLEELSSGALYLYEELSELELIAKNAG